MLVTDLETEKEVDLTELMASVLPKDSSHSKIPTKEQVEKELENNYHKALALQTKKFGGTDGPAMFLGGFGDKILQQVQNIVCKKIDDQANPNDVATLVIETLTSIIPGGFLLKPVVKMLTKFIIGQGLESFCALDFDKSKAKADVKAKAEVKV